jgi:hypothetical protein
MKLNLPGAMTEEEGYENMGHMVIVFKAILEGVKQDEDSVKRKNYLVSRPRGIQ